MFAERVPFIAFLHHKREARPRMIEPLTPERSAALAPSIARGDAQFQAGDGIDGEAVFTWMRSWGTDNELRAPTRTTRQA